MIQTHWILTSPVPSMNNPNVPIVLTVLDLMFDQIYKAHSDSSHGSHGVLSILLASIVHHSD